MNGPGIRCSDSWRENHSKCSHHQVFRPHLTSPLFFTGLSHTPRPDKAEISFTIGKDETYEAYVSHMGEFLKAYNDEKQEDSSKFEDCGGTISFMIIFELHMSQ